MRVEGRDGSSQNLDALGNASLLWRMDREGRF